MKTYRDLNGPRALPVIGNALQIRPDRIHAIAEGWAERYGPVYRMRVGPIPMVVLSDMETIRQIYNERPDRFRPLLKLQSIAADLGVVGLFVSEGDAWRSQRKIVVTALNAVQQEAFLPKLAVSVGRLQKKWEQAADTGEVVDVSRDLMQLTIDIAVQLTLGVDFNVMGTENPPLPRTLQEVVSTMLRRLYAPFSYWRYFNLPGEHKLKRELAEFRLQVLEIIREARERLRQNPTSAPASFLEAAIMAEKTEGWKVSDDELFANIGSLLMESKSTVPGTIAGFLYYLLRYPEHFARAQAEVDAAIGPSASVEDCGRTEQLPFLCAFSDEAMRLKPPVTFSALEPVEDAEILGYMLRKGTMIMVLHRQMALQDRHFGDARRFDPARWLSAHPPSADCPHNEDAFLRFGSGPRICPGRNHGLRQARAVLAMFCRHFDAEFAYPERPVEEKQGLTMMPSNLYIRVKRRNYPG